MNKVKVVTVGEINSGKTSLVMRLICNKFCTSESTIGASFLTYSHDNVKYEIWDTAGSERFAPLAPMYYRGADIFVLVFDTSYNDFINRLIYFFQSVERNNQKNYKIIVVGNKIDKINIEVDIPFIETIIKSYLQSEHIVSYIYLSALRGDNFDEFKDILINTGNEISKNKIIDDDQQIITLENDEQKCCWII